MANKGPGNSQVLTPAKFRRFDGIGGPQTQLLKRVNERGNDISNTLANDIQDFELTERGTLRIRAGSRKVLTSGYDDTVYKIIDIGIGYIPRYGVHHGTQLDVIDRPQWDLYPADPLFLTPVDAQGARSDERVPVFPGDPLQ